MRLALERMEIGKYFQVHHILQQDLFFVRRTENLSRRGKFLQSIGIHPHAKRNLMFLPTKKGKNWAANKAGEVSSTTLRSSYQRMLGRALHDGGHDKEYLEGVEKVVDAIRRDVNREILSKPDADAQVRAPSRAA